MLLATGTLACLVYIGRVVSMEVDALLGAAVELPAQRLHVCGRLGFGVVVEMEGEPVFEARISYRDLDLRGSRGLARLVKIGVGCWALDVENAPHVVDFIILLALLG